MNTRLLWYFCLGLQIRVRRFDSDPRLQQDQALVDYLIVKC